MPEYTGTLGEGLPVKLGSGLHPDDKKHVLAAYVHRFTKEHRPQWARRTRPDGDDYAVQFASDAEWLANTFFVVRKDGRLNHAVNRCESHATWPDNPENRPNA